MTTFGGSRKGYLLESFFPTADDLTAVLTDLQPRLLITNTRVPLDYESTSIDEWVRGYRRYAARVVSGKPVTWRLSMRLFISLCDPSVRVRWSSLDGQPYKLFDSDQPLVEVAPQMLFFDRGRLSLSIFNTDASAAFGLEIQVPRVSARHANSRLFQSLCERLRGRSRPCVFRSGKKLLRPRMSLSIGWGAEISRHDYLRRCGLTVEDGSGRSVRAARS